MNNQWFLLHGFPGLNSKLMLNQMACQLNSLPSTTAEVISYPGLHNSIDEFGFHKSVEFVLSLIKDTISMNSPKKIYLIGHSWGGFVSLAVGKKLNLANVHLVLLAPFTHFSLEVPSLQQHQAAELVQEAHVMNPDQFTSQLLPGLSEDLMSLVQEQNFCFETNKWLDESRFTFILGLQDAVLPPPYMKEFLRQFNENKLNLFELDDDHSFSCAPHRLIEIIQTLLG